MRVERTEDEAGDVLVQIYPFEDDECHMIVRHWNHPPVKSVLIPAYFTDEPDRLAVFAEAVRKAADVARELQDLSSSPSVDEL